MIECAALRLSRCYDCPDTCANTGQPVEEEQCVKCLNDPRRPERLREDGRRDEA